MSVAVVYSSNSGSTYICAGIISSILSCNMFSAKEYLSLKQDYDYLILGSPSWDYNHIEGMPHQDIIHLLDNPDFKKTNYTGVAIFGCGDKSYTHFCGAVDYLENYFKAKKTKQIVPSLRINSFYFDQINNENIVNTWAKELKKQLV